MPLLRKVLVLSAVTHAPFHASVLRPASQVGPMHERKVLISSTPCELTVFLRVVGFLKYSVIYCKICMKCRYTAKLFYLLSLKSSRGSSPTRSCDISRHTTYYHAFSQRIGGTIQQRRQRVLSDIYAATDRQASRAASLLDDRWRRRCRTGRAGAPSLLNGAADTLTEGVVVGRVPGDIARPGRRRPSRRL